MTKLTPTPAPSTLAPIPGIASDRELPEPRPVAGARRSGSCSTRSARSTRLTPRPPVARPLSRTLLQCDPLAALGSAPLSLRIPGSLRADLEAVAKGRDRSLNWLSIRALQLGLRSLANTAAA